jgi:ferrous iron transport protein B
MSSAGIIPEKSSPRREPPKRPTGQSRGTVLIVGNPNVGKSALFNWLTGRYVAVSNYPGTTVEVSRGRSKLLPDLELIDTPGMYSLTPITDEERVTQSILLTTQSRAVVHVIDAKNIARLLALTLQLIEAGLAVVLVLNMWDEALSAGVKIDCEMLRRLLGIPVVPTVATSGKGMDALVATIDAAIDRCESGDANRPASAEAAIDYGPALEKAIADIQAHLPDDDCPVSRRTRSVLLLHGDHQERQRMAERCDAAAVEEIARIVFQATMDLKHTAHYHTALAVKAGVEKIVAQSAVLGPQTSGHLRDRLSHLCMNPWTGVPLLLAVLYFGLYKFVGDFGAGFLVDKLSTLFEHLVSPWVNRAVAHIPWEAVRDLIAGSYGIVPLGLRYAIAIIFPIVGTFFLAFSILEDSGYLPRLAMLVDRLFKTIGLNGRAVIPMVLGLGCDTMATMVTRTLETHRERVIATFLLALAIPCSAQMGLILGLLAGHGWAVAVWAGVIVTVFLAAGLAAAKFMPGNRPTFYMELPPLRLPRLGNVLIKTYTRMIWYFKEVLPLFVLASVLIWLGQMSFWGLLPEGGLFGLMLRGLVPVVRSMGLPDDASVAFLFGFFRRDYGAAGLYDLHGRMSGNQLVVAAVTLTLFLPCIAQVLIMKKERGWRMTLLVSAFIIVFAYAIGLATHWVLRVTGANL